MYSHETANEVHPGDPDMPVVGASLCASGELAPLVGNHRLGPILLNVGHLVRLTRMPMPESAGGFRERLRLVVSPSVEEDSRYGRCWEADCRYRLTSDCQ